MIVVDASALVDYLLGRGAVLDAIAHELRGREHEPLHAPELIEPESVNALRRLAAGRAVSDERAGAAIADLGRVRLVRYSSAPLRERVWALRDELTAYDATYLALAEALPARRLLTGDRGLATRAERWLGPERVRRL